MRGGGTERGREGEVLCLSEEDEVEEKEKKRKRKR